MNSNFDARKPSWQKAPREMDSLQRDRFELLSAYIDGEVTAAERYQVQEWLDTDPNMKCLYARLVKLRQGVQKLPVPQTETTAQETARHVFARIDRRRIRNTVVWGGAAIAALFVSAVSGVFPGSQPSMLRFAESPEPKEVAEPLMIAVNRPVIEIPKAAVSSVEKFVEAPAVNPDLN
ncbi:MULTISPECIES: anti-sigma factor family protein [unclassified Coleofasciculus]|uniref:anti-sigma factor family protein n=1 Tax=unclassified Coleofasciculus TaxID=2692782 RepID=UPI00187E2668|nr:MULTISPECIES: Fis family transcriptional regulator [unclassified Coleofasciculus]MBE9127714.1 Fis family transcriptional regulator [Coleofasciculus sp. LEGE 07081]MBE9149696.1 Fis family transcriptional regulator [Coleofasciculus sp. LEGE 07092]